MKAHVESEEIPLVTADRRATVMRTREFRLHELRVEAKQEVLFSFLWTTFHPLTLSKQLHGAATPRMSVRLRLLLDLNDLFATVPREENTYAMLSYEKLERKIKHTSIRVHVRNTIRLIDVILKVVVVVEVVFRACEWWG